MQQKFITFDFYFVILDAKSEKKIKRKKITMRMRSENSKTK